MIASAVSDQIPGVRRELTYGTLESGGRGNARYILKHMSLRSRMGVGSTLVPILPESTMKKGERTGVKRGLLALIRLPPPSYPGGRGRMETAALVLKSRRDLR